MSKPTNDDRKEVVERIRRFVEDTKDAEGEGYVCLSCHYPFLHDGILSWPWLCPECEPKYDGTNGRWY